MTFDEWWSKQGFINGEALGYAEEAWNTAFEECAKICEAEKDAWAHSSYDLGCKDCAKSIRKRVQQP